MNPTISSESLMRVVIIMPLRDDWKSASTLIRQLDPILKSQGFEAEIVLVDDDSQQASDRADFQNDFQAVTRITVVRLCLNLGHQRAIAIGLAEVFSARQGDAVLIMDSDGEDTPAGVGELLQAFRRDGGENLIFAERIRRSESLLFRCLYHLYRLLARILTGLSVRVGNFSILPWRYLKTLVVQSELWNHYAASVFRSKRPIRMTPIPRGKRIDGSSRMNFSALVIHGLSAISVFGDVVGTRLLIASLLGSFFAFGGIVALAAFWMSHHSVSGWAVYAAGTLAMILVQLITVAAIFTFFMLSNRTNLGFVPLRDYSLFVSERFDLYLR